MYTLSVLTLLALAPISSILAAPAPAVNALEVRSNTPIPGDVVAGLMGLKNDYTLLAGWQAANSWTGPASLDVNFCECDNSAPAFQWYITIPNDNRFDSSCGAGFLDNFRGRCGVITSWGCEYIGADLTTAALWFWTDVACTLDDATQVIAAASENNIPSMQCAYAESEGGDVGQDMPFGGDGSDDPED